MTPNAAAAELCVRSIEEHLWFVQLQLSSTSRLWLDNYATYHVTFYYGMHWMEIWHSPICPFYRQQHLGFLCHIYAEAFFETHQTITNGCFFNVVSNYGNRHNEHNWPSWKSQPRILIFSNGVCISGSIWMISFVSLGSGHWTCHAIMTYLPFSFLIDNDFDQIISEGPKASSPWFPQSVKCVWVFHYLERKVFS